VTARLGMWLVWGFILALIVARAINGKGLCS
jgi:hypothetical protein